MIFATEETIVKECPLGFFKLRMRGRDDVLAFNHLVFGLNFPIITDTFKYYTYLLLVSDYLKSISRTGLDGRWSLVPVGGADLVPSFVALLGHHLEVTVLIDSRKEGNQRLQKMADQGILELNRIITVGEVTKTKLADIEDLFTVDEYLNLYNSAFGATIKSADLSGTDPIVSRIARFLKVDRFDHGRPADALLRSRDKFLPSISPDTVNRFEELFKRVNATLK